MSFDLLYSDWMVEKLYTMPMGYNLLGLYVSFGLRGVHFFFMVHLLYTTPNHCVHVQYPYLYSLYGDSVTIVCK